MPLTLAFSCGAAGNRTRHENRAELRKRGIRRRKTTRKNAKRPADTRKVLMASTRAAASPVVPGTYADTTARRSSLISGPGEFLSVVRSSTRCLVATFRVSRRGYTPRSTLIESTVDKGPPLTIGCQGRSALRPGWLRLGGRLAVMARTAGRAARLLRILPNTGVHLFGDDELGDILEDHCFIGVRTKSLGTIEWVRAKRG